MDLRRATPDDAPALAEVHVNSWRSAYRGLVPDSYLASLDEARREEQFREFLKADSQETYLAEQNGEVLGFLTLGDCRDCDVDHKTTAEIWGIYLAPAHWRKGIGCFLCRQAERMLRSRGYEQATLWVFEENEPARRFYEAMGFEPDGASKILNPGAPLKAVRYRKALKDAEPGGAPACS
jgi:ribosomal protein S18 acetylase RimI-like enzyme